jgi:hypothetical protein
MTSTGMSTFSGLSLEEPPSGYERRRPPPRKALAVSTIGLLTVAGAAGVYLAVVNGLGSLVPEKPAAADTFPARPAATSNAEIGAGPVAAAPGRAAVTTTTTTSDGRVVTAGEAPAPRPPAAGVVPPARGTQNASPIRTTIPTSPECKCNPPAPTPTAPTGSPSPTASASPSPSSSGSASPSGSATPDESAEPSDSPQARRSRHRH